jgi:hypothetical protein
MAQFECISVQMRPWSATLVLSALHMVADSSWQRPAVCIQHPCALNQVANLPMVVLLTRESSSVILMLARIRKQQQPRCVL